MEPKLDGWVWGVQLTLLKNFFFSASQLEHLSNTMVFKYEFHRIT